MALQVWLPLTKDLRQQGLCNIIPTNNNAVYNATGGKLGGCYTFTNQTISMVPTSELKNSFNGAASLACWVKVSTSHNAYAQCITYGTVSTAWTAIYFGIDINGSGVPIGNIANGSNNTNCSFSTAIKDNQWHHLCLTYTTGTIKSYLDGVLKTTTSTSYVPAWTNATILTIGGNSSEVFKNGDAMNDVRLYNHCLSPMEVKELAKGLILHYPLNRGGWGQENLFKTKPCSGGVRWVAQGNGVKIDWTSNAGDTYWYLQLADGVSLIQGNTYTFSCKCSGIGSNTIMFRWCNLVGYEIYLSNGWNYYTFNMPSTNITNPFFDDINRDTTLSNLLIWDFKLEEGSIATPWCPNSSDALATTMGLNSTIEYDCSGFCNNLNKNGTYSYTSDTPKYTVSTVFNGTEWMNGTTPGAEILTLACWAKTTKNKSTSQFMVADSTSGLCISFYSGTIISYFGSGSQSTGSKCTLGSAYKENDWNHFVVVKTGVGTRTVYCNGTEQTATSNDYWGSAAGLFIGSRNNSATLPFYGELSDVRAYATALSADDVLSLYQNSAYIDNNGNVYGAIHTEV